MKPLLTQNFLVKLYTGFLFIFLCSHNLAQPVEKLIYLNGGISGGTLSGGQIGINLVVNHKYSVQLEYSGVMRKAKDTPDDYSGGFFSFLTFNSLSPIDQIESFRLMPGIVSLGKTSGKLKSNIKAGISFLTIQEPVNWIKDPAGGLLLVPNYEWDIKTSNHLGLIVKADFAFTTGKYIGLITSPYLEISKITTIGICFDVLLGKVGDWEK